MRSIGVIGGTFDPPHLAHLLLASEAQDQFSLDRVLWILTPVPPHKPGRQITPLAIRREMLLAAIQGNPYFEFSSVDCDREPPHYAADTMDLIRQSFPDTALTYLMGADSLQDLPDWHTPELFIQRCDYLGVMPRIGSQDELSNLKTLFPEIQNKVRYIHIPRIDLSSSDIRQRVAQGKSVRYFVPESVFQIIHNYNLYRGI